MELRSPMMGSVSWRHRRASSLVPVQTWEPENQENQWCKSWCSSEDPSIQGNWCSKIQAKSEGLRPRSTSIWRQKMDVPTETESKFILSLPFHSIQADWMIPTCISKGNLLDSLYWFKWNTVIDITQNLCLTSYLGIPSPSQADT